MQSDWTAEFAQMRKIADQSADLQMPVFQIIYKRRFS